MNDERIMDEHDSHEQTPHEGTASENAASDAAPNFRRVDSGNSLTLPRQQVEHLVIDVLKSVYDPEIPVNIYDLGLIYSIDINEKNEVLVSMTLTTPACPVAGSLPGEVEQRLRSTAGIADAKVVLTWEPPWDYHDLSDEIKLQLGLL